MVLAGALFSWRPLRRRVAVTRVGVTRVGVTRVGNVGVAALVAIATLAGCSQAPLLKLPDVPIAPGWREASTAPWVPATTGTTATTSAISPPDRLPAEAWWSIFGDSELDGLQQRLLADSPDLAAALARYQQAQAATDLLRASQWPTLGASLNLQRNRQSERRPLRVLGPTSPNDYNAATLGFDVGYEVDVWGRVSQLVQGGEAEQRAARADLAGARLSLQAQLTDSLLVLRGLDRDLHLLRGAESAYSQAVDLVQRRHRGGASSGLDLARAQAQLDTTRSQQRQTLAQRAVVEHAIAALLGQSPSTFTIAAPASLMPSAMAGEPTSPKASTAATSPTPRRTAPPGLPPPLALPPIPIGVPSTLLQRRPDIAAAQQRVAAANASVGVTQAAFFPALTLSAVGGFQSSDFGHFLAAPKLFWAIGPNLVASLFDGGRRDASRARARAVLDEAGARYRSVVIAAFQQVEDNLSLLDHYGAAAQAEQAAVEAAQRALTIATNRYRQGAASYLDVITAQTTTLQAQRSAADLATRQRRASVQLVRALGGGWSDPALASASVSPPSPPSPPSPRQPRPN